MAPPHPRTGAARRARTLTADATGSAPALAADTTVPGDGAVHMVVVHHDRPEACARTVAAFASLDGVSSVCVVDSSSDPASAARLRVLLVDTEMADTEIIDAGGNVGFGPGANLGIRRWLDQGSGHWVGVAPHDAIPAPDAVRLLLDEVAGRPAAGLVCAEFGPDYAVVPVFDKVLGGYYRPGRRGSGWQEVDYPHGTLLLARRALLDDVGLFDERYFAYCEEVDLGLRARASGWMVGLVWGAIVTNGRLPSRRIADYLQLRNTLLLLRTHQGPAEVRVRVVLAVASALRHAARSPVDLHLAGRALMDYRRRRFGPPPPQVVALARRRNDRRG